MQEGKARYREGWCTSCRQRTSASNWLIKKLPPLPGQAILAIPAHWPWLIAIEYCWLHPFLFFSESFHCGCPVPIAPLYIGSLGAEDSFKFMECLPQRNISRPE